MEPMNETTIHATPASRREGTVMGMKRNRKQLVAAAIAIAGLTGGAVAVNAATLSDRYPVDPTDQPIAWPSMPTTTCGTDADGNANTCDIWLYAGFGEVDVQDVTPPPAHVQPVHVLGFQVSNEPIADHAAVALAGDPLSTIKVPVGTTLTIHFSQDSDLADPIDLSFPSLLGSATNNLDGTFTVSAGTVGTSVFQPGSNDDAPEQIAMGLVGTLIVTPQNSVSLADCATCAYNGDSAYSDEVVVATTDLDLALPTTTTPTGSICRPRARLTWATSVNPRTPTAPPGRCTT